MVSNTTSNNNEKICHFSKGLILENGIYLINVKDKEKLNEYKWWKGLIKPKDAFNPKKTKGFLVLKLFLYGYLNRISTYRSNKDNDLMYPYLKILLNNVEIYRTRVLDSNLHIWEEKIEIEIHYIKSKIEIQLFDMDETEGIVEDEYIGSAFIDIIYLEMFKKYDIILKYVNRVAILMDTYHYKGKSGDDESAADNATSSFSSSSSGSGICNNNKKNEGKGGKMNSAKEESNNRSCNKRAACPSNPNLYNYTNDYNVRIFVKLSNKQNYNNFILQLNTISSLNYTCIHKKNPILDKDLNVYQLYEELKKIKGNIDTIWLPFFSIIYNFASWKTPLYSLFFVVFFFFSFFFPKFFLSFFLVVLSLIFFILVSIIRESDKLKRANQLNTIVQPSTKKKKKKK